MRKAVAEAGAGLKPSKRQQNRECRQIIGRALRKDVSGAEQSRAERGYFRAVGWRSAVAIQEVALYG